MLRDISLLIAVVEAWQAPNLLIGLVKKTVLNNLTQEVHDIFQVSLFPELISLFLEGKTFERSDLNFTDFSITGGLEGLGIPIIRNKL